MVMNYSHAKVQGQIVSRFRTEWKRTDRRTDGQTEAIALPAALLRSVIASGDVL